MHWVSIFSISAFTFFGFRIVILTMQSLPLGDEKEEEILFVSFCRLLGVVTGIRGDLRRSYRYGPW